MNTSAKFRLSLVVVFATLLFNLSFAQVLFYNEYKGLESANLTTAIRSNFQEAEPNQDWSGRFEQMDVKHNGQSMQIRSTDEAGGIHYRQINSFIPDKNFQIESRIKLGKGCTEAGLVFCAQTEQNYSYVCFNTLERVFKVVEVREGMSNEVIRKQLFGEVRMDNYNKITVRKAADMMYFFLNETLMEEKRMSHLQGRGIGWYIANKGQIYVENLLVNGISTTDKIPPILNIVSTPNISILSRHEDSPIRSFRLSTSKQEAIVVFRVKDQSGIKSVWVNGIEPLKLEGEFIKIRRDVLTESKEFDIRVVDNFDNVATANISLEYDPPVVVQNTPNESLPQMTPSFPANSRGKNVALFIGITDYGEFQGRNYNLSDDLYWTRLNNPINDCNAIAKLLTTQYQFAPQNIRFLFNENATRDKIIDTFEALAKELTPEDNLVIYYAGHGFYNQVTNIGYWVPVDAQKNQISKYIPNSDIRNYLGSFNSFHTLIIADACFAGSMIGMRGDALKESYKSRWVITSGNMEMVDDGPPGQHSPFAKALIETLRDNQQASLNADDLFKHINRKMRNNANQMPQGAPIKDVGDEGGVFVFKRKGLK